jgi:hypothetical protein
MQTTDFAKASYREAWLHHPVVGDPSWDAFDREPNNPIYTGRPPFPWAVNGFLFRDPPTGRWYAYVGLYPRGYWPPPAAQCLLMREKSAGGWEELGVVLKGDPKTFDGDGRSPGAMPDVSVVWADGRYHMIYDWCDPQNIRGGLAYAWAERPEGPFHRAEQPIHDDRNQAPLAGCYVRVYGGTLLRRKSDWLVLCMMSTPHNQGGTWALAAMTADRPQGPYRPPILLLYPQSDTFMPPLMEFYPAFQHEGFAYAPATSVAANRTFQAIFRAPLEDAHRPASWDIHQHGSVWHAEPVPSEGMGLWGQTFSGQVAPDGTLRAFFPCKARNDVGTIGMARRPWKAPYRDGFWLSAPNGPAAAVLRRNFSNFELAATAKAEGNWAIAWDCTGPLGPDRIGAAAVVHPKMRVARTEWQRRGSAWAVHHFDDQGEARQLAAGNCGRPADGIETIDIARFGSRVAIRVNGAEVWSGETPGKGGRIELYAEQGTFLRVEKFDIAGKPGPGYESWLAMESFSGAGELQGHWLEETDNCFRWGVGHVSANSAARAKWNYLGRGFRLFLPKGPRYGDCEVLADGLSVAKLNLSAPTPEASAVVLQRNLAAGLHAVILKPIRGKIPCDSLEIIHENDVTPPSSG